MHLAYPSPDPTHHIECPSVREHLGAGPRRCDSMAKDKDNGLFVMKRGGDALPPDGDVGAKRTWDLAYLADV
jgi:hypothetical protein